MQTGEDARDAGINAVLNHNKEWAAAATQYLLTHHRGEEITTEQIRLALEKQGITPDDHHAWGGLTFGWSRHGLIEDAGKVQWAQSPRSHKTRLTVWKVIGEKV